MIWPLSNDILWQWQSDVVFQTKCPMKMHTWTLFHLISDLQSKDSASFHRLISLQMNNSRQAQDAPQSISGQCDVMFQSCLLDVVIL